MNDLDTLRTALRSLDDVDLHVPDLERIMSAGLRLRRRRRLVTGGAAAAVVAVAVLALLVTVVWPGRPTSPAAQPAAATTTTVFAGQSPPANADRPVGDVISTGRTETGVELVLYAIAIDDARLPRTHFGIMAGRRDTSGGLTADVLANEAARSDLAPGFHALSQSRSLANNSPVPAFGYFVGPVARVVGVVDRHRHATAHLAPWSANPHVVVFWFDPAEVSPGQEVTLLYAYDGAGHRL